MHLPPLKSRNHRRSRESWIEVSTVRNARSSCKQMPNIMEAFDNFWRTIFAILNLLSSLWGPSLTPPKCPIELWVFSDSSSCGEATPTVTATLHADDTCRPTNSNGNDNPMLPGNYVAACTFDGRLVIKQSGCSSVSCNVDSQTDPHCNQDGSSTTATLYSKLTPAFPLQQSDDYSCLEINDAATGIVISFVLFGDCSLSGCVVDGELL